MRTVAFVTLVCVLDGLTGQTRALVDAWGAL